MFATDAPSRIWEDLPFMSIPAAICFGAAFLLLGVARRAGFTALWLLLFGLWAWQAFFARHDHGPRVQIEFLSWSLFAGPLYAMVLIGFPSAAASPRRALGTWGVVAAWVGLATLALRYELFPVWYDLPLKPIWPFLKIAWLLLPPVLSASAIWRVHRGARSSVAAA